jgi:hypothetical protein
MSCSEQRKAACALILAVLETIEEFPDGVPGGPVYAALMTRGCSLDTFYAIMEILLMRGLVVRKGQLYVPTYKGKHTTWPNQVK